MSKKWCYIQYATPSALERARGNLHLRRGDPVIKNTNLLQPAGIRIETDGVLLTDSEKKTSSACMSQNGVEVDGQAPMNSTEIVEWIRANDPPGEIWV